MTPKTPLMKKLRLEPQMRALIINMPESFTKALGIDPSNLNLLADFEEDLTFILQFARYQSQILDLMPQITKALEEDGLFWVAYPKKSSKVESDLGRDIFWTLLSDYGYRPVSQISIDEVWSALRFRPTHLVGK